MITTDVTISRGHNYFDDPGGEYIVQIVLIESLNLVVNTSIACQHFLK